MSAAFSSTGCGAATFEKACFRNVEIENAGQGRTGGQEGEAERGGFFKPRAQQGSQYNATIGCRPSAGSVSRMPRRSLTVEVYRLRRTECTSTCWALRLPPVPG